MNVNGGRRCAACKYLRRRCSEDCILAPYFHNSQPERFAFVHGIFGASNVARMLQQLPSHNRAEAADAIAMEAQWRVQDPVYGCTEIIARLQLEILKAQNEIAILKAQIAIHKAQQQNQGQFNLDMVAHREKAHSPQLPYLPPDFF